MKRLTVAHFPSTLKHDAWLGLCCLPALMLIFFVGYYLERMQTASIVASGAITLAYGANKTWESSSLLLLLATAVGVTVSTWLGSLAGNVMPLYIFGSMLYAGLYAMLASIQSGLWWALLQCAIAWLVAGYFAGSPLHAAERAALVGIGGLLQIVCLVLLFSKIRFQLQDVTRHNWADIFQHARQRYRQKIHIGWSVFFAMAAMGIALWMVERHAVGNGYWAGMTLLLCLRNDFRQSVRRVPARILGTLLGSLTATLLLTFLHTPLMLATGLTVAGYVAFTASYTLSTRSYFIFTFLVTVTVIFLMSSLGLPQHNVAINRVISTTTGGLFALGAILLARMMTDFHVMKKLRQRAAHLPDAARSFRRRDTGNREER